MTLKGNRPRVGEPRSNFHTSDSSDSTMDSRPIEERIRRSSSEKLARLKDSSKAWVVCFAAFVIQVLDVGVLHVFGVFFVALIDEFHSTRATVGKPISSLYFNIRVYLVVSCANILSKPNIICFYIAWLPFQWICRYIFSMGRLIGLWSDHVAGYSGQHTNQSIRSSTCCYDREHHMFHLPPHFLLCPIHRGAICHLLRHVRSGD